MKTGIIVAVAALAAIGAAATAGIVIHQRSSGPLYTADAKYASRSQYTNLTLVGGNSARIRLLTALSSETSQVGDPVAAVLISPWLVGGQTVLPAGIRIEGRVTRAESVGRLKHNAKLGFRFDEVILPDGERVSIASRPLRFEAGGETKRDIIDIGAGTVAGGVIGALTGNTARGAVIGAAAGTGAALYQEGDPVTVRAGATLRLTLSGELKVAVRNTGV